MSEIRFFIFFLRKQVNVVAIYNTGNKVRGIILELKITNSSCQVINPYLFFYLSACVEYNWGSRDKQDCHTSVCSLVLCLVTTKIWSDGHQSPRRVAALGSWTNLCYSSQANQCYSSILFRRQQESERERESEREKSARTRERESMRECFGSSFYMFFSSTWACPVQIGLSQECCLFCLKSSLWSLDLPLTFLVFQPPPFWTPFPYSTYLTGLNM